MNAAQLKNIEKPQMSLENFVYLFWYCDGRRKATTKSNSQQYLFQT